MTVTALAEYVEDIVRARRIHAMEHECDVPRSEVRRSDCPVCQRAHTQTKGARLVAQFEAESRRRTQ